MTQFHFPLQKKVRLNNTSTGFLTNYQTHTEIPLTPHPGSFGFERKNHNHEGVDLYCEAGDAVFAIEDGVVIDIYDFTGEFSAPPSKWWNNTQAVLVQSTNATYNYGEIMAAPHLKVNDRVRAGELIGHVKTVLKKDKGRPMSMLHLELYTPGTQKAIPSWPLAVPKPNELLDPTPLLLSIANLNLLNIQSTKTLKI